MTQLLALSLSIGVLGAVWAFLALGPLSGFVLVWAGFIAWAASSIPALTTRRSPRPSSARLWSAPRVDRPLDHRQCSDASTRSKLAGDHRWSDRLLPGDRGLRSTCCRLFRQMSTVTRRWWPIRCTNPRPRPRRDRCRPATSAPFANPRILLIVSMELEPSLAMPQGKLPML